MTELEIQSTPPASYLYGEELLAHQIADRDKVPSPSNEGFYPWAPGELVVSAMSMAQDWQDRRSVFPVELLDNPVIVESDTFYFEHMQKVLTWARKNLLMNPEIEPEAIKLCDTDFIHWIHERRTTFQAEALEHQEKLQATKATFIERIEYAIDHQGFPLTHQQLYERLKGLEIDFSDPLRTSSDTKGGYIAGIHRIIITLSESSLKGLEKTVFHELLHAISAKRIVKAPNELGIETRKIGLKQPNQSRLWLNEAITELLADILLDEKGTGYTFNNDTHMLWHGDPDNIYEVLLRAVNGQERLSYYEEKLAVIAATLRVPSKVLMRAYFAEDHDNHEADPRAGTHAERDLQRALKVAGGAKRVAELRAIDKLFTEDLDDKALEQAKKIEKHDLKVRPHSLKNRRNVRKIAKYTANYREQIQRAKDALRAA